MDTAIVDDDKLENPQSFEEALQSRLSRKWKEAADSEYQSLIDGS